MHIFVFLGSSIDVNQAKTILPEAHYLPPIACGDIISLMPLKPDIIVIIDGYFENRPAVWHKEILCAIHQGVIVYGASSMGALRAAELDRFGMLGIGEIYHRYATNRIIDDDEVALVHSYAMDGFKSYTLPMINIRITVELALKHKIISQGFADEFLAIAKAIFYQERNYDVLKAKCSHLQNIQEFFNWFNSNYVDQKMLDAKEVLNVIHKQSYPPVNMSPSSLNIEQNFSNTALIRGLKTEKLSMPCSFFYESMPIAYQICFFAKLFKNDYTISKILAKTIGITHDCGFLEINQQQVYPTNALLDNKLYHRIINCLIKFSTMEISTTRDKSYEILAKILSILYSKLSPHFATVNSNSMAKIIQDIYRKHKIDSKEQFSNWLYQRELDLNEFNFAVVIFHILDYFIISNNLYILYPPKTPKNVSHTIMAESEPLFYNYFSIALSLNSLDKTITQTFLDEKESLLTQNREYLKALGDTYAITQDFTDAFEMRNFITKLSNCELNYLVDCKLDSWILL